MPSTTTSTAVPALLAADECLSVVDGHLHIEGVACGELARRFGTPLHVLSEHQLRHNARRWQRALGRAWPDGPVLVMPSLKANYGLAVRALMNDEQLGCDVFGGSELEIALRAGVPAQRISLNGATKLGADLERAIEAGVRITLDSADEFTRVARFAAQARRPASIRFRIRPELDVVDVPSDFAPGDLSAADALRDYRAGMPWEEVLSCFAALPEAPWVELTGLMTHVTRQSTDLRLWASLGRALGRAVGELTALDPAWRPRELDIGGGFAVPRDPLGHARAGSWDGELAPSPDAYLAAVGGALADQLHAAGVDPSGVQLEAEPGRAMFADAGIHLASVRHIKHASGARPRTWIETDTSEAFLPDTIIEGNRWHIVLVDDPERRERLTAAITGVSCGWDILVPSTEQPAARVGERIAFLDTGAYQDAASNNFNALLRPATVLVRGAGAELVRRGERLADIVGRDVIPDRLSTS